MRDGDHHHDHRGAGDDDEPDGYGAVDAPIDRAHTHDRADTHDRTRPGFDDLFIAAYDHDDGALMADETYHPEYGELPIPAYDWPPAYIAVINQAPTTSYTTALLPQNQLHLTPSARRPRAAKVGPGDPAPDFDLLCSDGRR
jgi:hypothetical protein